MLPQLSVSKILIYGCLWVLQNYQNSIELTSNMICIVALGVGLKCPREIHLYTQWGGDCSIPERFEVKCLKFPPYLWIMVAFSGFNYPSYAMR